MDGREFRLAHRQDTQIDDWAQGRISTQEYLEWGYAQTAGGAFGLGVLGAWYIGPQALMSMSVRFPKTTAFSHSMVAGEIGAVYLSGGAAKGLEVGASRLVGANRAVIDPRKLTEYALNPNHPVGGNKAKVFESVLGFNQSNASTLMTQLQKGVMNVTPIAGKSDKFGTRFTLDIPVTGPLGSGTVRTGWIYKPGSNTPELTTLFVK